MIDTTAETGKGKAAGRITTDRDFARPCDELVTLRVAWWADENRPGRMIQAIRLFEKKYPRVRISPIFAPWEEYRSMLEAQSNMGVLPDVMQQEPETLPAWASRGALLNLNQAVREGLLDLTDVPEERAAAGQVAGQLYGVSLVLLPRFYGIIG